MMFAKSLYQWLSVTLTAAIQALCDRFNGQCVLFYGVAGNSYGGLPSQYKETPRII